MKNSLVEDDVKLDFSDVLIKPSKSQVTSRKDVKLECDYKFTTCGQEWSGIPIMASNMDGVGTIEMAETLGKQGLFTCLVKTYSAQELIDFFDGYGEYRTNTAAMSIGISDSDYDKFKLVYNTVMPNRLKFVCIDVANGYSKAFTDFIDKLRKEFPEVTIIAGNVVTKDMTRELIKHGVDIVKVGIGPGCFLPGTIVNTANGPKNIEDVKVGEIVKTHTGAEKPVIATLVYDNTKPIISINGIKSTDSHEYYVLHKKYKDIVNDENIHELAEWVEAKDLTKEFLLLKHK